MRACLLNSADHHQARRLLYTSNRLVSSELLWFEADRTAIRLAQQDAALAALPQQVSNALNRIGMIPLNHTIVNAARAIPQVIKSLDAIHVASAESLGRALTCIVTYDKTMCAVLAQRGLRATTAPTALSQYL